MRGCSRRVRLAEYSRVLIRLYQRIEGAAPTVAQLQALAVLGDDALRQQFVVGVREEWVRRELRWLMMGSADKPFIVVQEEALCLMCKEDRDVLMRSMEKATLALSVPSACVSVVDSVADVLCVGGVVLGDGGLSCVGGVGLCASRACCCDAMVGPSAELVAEQARLAVCDAVVGPSAELVSEQAGLAICDVMVGPSAELDFTQAGLADSDTVVDVCDAWRAQWRLPRCPIFELIWNRTCFAV